MNVFAGDKHNPHADASYRNLLWENLNVNHSYDIGNKIRKSKEIGRIDSWGPFFRVSFDLIIHSHAKNGYSSIIDFKGNGGTSDCCEMGDRIPSIQVSKNPVYPLHLRFANAVNQNGNYYFDFFISLSTWYNIIIEVQSLKSLKKVREKKFPLKYNN